MTVDEALQKAQGRFTKLGDEIPDLCSLYQVASLYLLEAVAQAISSQKKGSTSSTPGE
jgi:hypothetical protein